MAGVDGAPSSDAGFGCVPRKRISAASDMLLARRGGRIAPNRSGRRSPQSIGSEMRWSAWLVSTKGGHHHRDAGWITMFLSACVMCLDKLQGGPKNMLFWAQHIFFRRPLGTFGASSACKITPLGRPGTPWGRQNSIFFDFFRAYFLNVPVAAFDKE